MSIISPSSPSGCYRLSQLPPSTPGPATCRASHGFTLFEIVAVLLLMALLSATVLPRLLASDDFDLRTETDVLASHLRYAQAMAMGTLKPCGITYAAGSYHLFRSTAPATPVNLPGEQTQSVSLPTGMTVTISTGGATISFNAKGVPCSDTAASTPLTANAVLTVSHGGDSETITVTQQTGFIP